MIKLDILWNIFKNTGDIRYYNLFSSVKGSKRDENRKGRGTSNWRN